MTQLYPNVMQWVVRAESDVRDLAALKGKRVVPGAQNSATELNSREMLGILGLDYRTRSDVKADYMDYNQAADKIKNKQADATLLAGGVPTAAVIDVMTMGDARLLSLPDDYIKQLVAKYPWYSPFTIPAGSYPKQDRDVKTVAVTNILLVRNDLPEALVHDLLAAMYADAPRLAAAHSAMKAFKLEDALLGIRGVIDLHPGAARFYKEKGIASR
jgi:TRAP transporter TAXI family solute receptor